ncbi:hypothetical protein K435DRAFT_807003 [Dendrothele bispora CBS 962.96]|uniref:DUF6534 domain-containing protein n=1 Tax=Dendrothele bispora (strain CBS 962.96) TaxID=1314807 RepID=A0A4S8L653_DENBC|nr:hypothetical protein K435DRAFT_807003 [Dendrothele bispora CBS 962.96]
MSLASLTPDRISPIDQSTFNDIFGGGLITCMIMLVLYGLAVLQTYMYFLNYGRDSLAMKTLVLSYSKPLSLIDGEWSSYVLRPNAVFPKKWRLIITSALGILILGQVVFGICENLFEVGSEEHLRIMPFWPPSTDLSYRAFSIWQVLNIHEMVYDAMVPLFVIRVLSDTLTAVALCIILFDSRTGSSQSLRLIKTLMIYAMERFVLTTVVVLFQTIVLVVKPTSIWAMVIESITPQLYTNSFLATLNSRNHLRDIGSSVVGSWHISSTGVRSNVVDTRPGTSQVMNINTDNGQFNFKYEGGVRIGETLVMTDLATKTHTDGNSV